ncbi:MAG: glutamate--tRNA ligase [Pseudomonadota bacterium]
MSKVITRFPPSPTGHLHIGGARTAIFNWLFARHHGGRFVFRVEDTDVARSTKESIQAIIESLEWLGMDWDEGPHFQTERLGLYQQKAFELVAQGKAYWCACKPEELDAKRKKALATGQKPKYDGRCRGLGLSEQPGAVIRFRAPQEGRTVVRDLIKGTIAFDNTEMDDLIILRSDGVATYNFAVVIDDTTMGITHVIRGDDHLNNTPRQIQLYEALETPLPEFAHVPMILGTDRTRLSKRHGATSVLAYRDMGYPPEALFNYLVRLGWSHGDQEIFSRQELIEKFSLENVGRSAGIFNPDKLLWLNAHYLKAAAPATLAPLLKPLIEAKGCNAELDYLAAAATTLQTRSRTLTEMADGAEFYCREMDYEPKAAGKFLVAASLEPLRRLRAKIETASFDHDSLAVVFDELATLLGLKLGQVAQPVRVALTGKTVSPGVFEIMEVLGRERVMARLDRAIAYVESHGEPQPGVDESLGTV